MTSSHRDVTGEQGVIRGARVNGVIFCSPTGQVATKTALLEQEQESVKALEDYWYNKGLEEGKKSGYQEAFSEGDKKGYERGFQEGESKGTESGFEEGKTAGIQEGEDRCKEEANAAVEAMENLGGALKQELARTVEEIKPELIRFAITVCDTLLHRELSDPETFATLLDHLITSARSIIADKTLDVKLSPIDLQKVEPYVDNIKSKHPELDHLNLVADISLPEGICKVESTLGLVKWDIKRQLQDIEKHVLEVQPNEPQDTLEVVDEVNDETPEPPIPADNAEGVVEDNADRPQ